MPGYYASRIDSLRDIFGARQVTVAEDAIEVDGRSYPVVDDVIVLLPEERRPRALGSQRRAEDRFAADIQSSFGAEWTEFPRILPEHEAEFASYFDLVDLASWRDARVCDAGCGIGRWSQFVAPHCRELVLVDFSEAIFVARRNLADAPNTFFFMGDILDLPFRPAFAQALFSLGVLHHLPVPALEAVRSLGRFADELLVYLYYALDNRPAYFRWALTGVTGLRQGAARLQNPRIRSVGASLAAATLYAPLVALGSVLELIGQGNRVPLYETYRGKGWERIRQDAYDRFFTRIEQRVSRREILALTDAFAEVTLSDQLPYWHFVCRHPLTASRAAVPARN